MVASASISSLTCIVPSWAANAAPVRPAMMMAAIIMAGRTGAAFAAQLGTMQVNEEIDALATMGIPAMDFLVLPRMLALALMMPLLGVYADLLGVLGGAVVGIGMLVLGSAEYYYRTIQAIGLDDFAAGIVKASVFGVLVASGGRPGG